MIIVHGVKTPLLRSHLHTKIPPCLKLWDEKYYGAKFSSSSHSENAIPPPKPRRLFRKFLFFGVLSIGAFIGSLYTSETVRNELVTYYPPSKQMLNWVESSIGGWYSSGSGKQQSAVTPPVSDFPLPPKQKPEPTPPSKPSPSPEPANVEKEKPPLPTEEEVKDMISRRHIPLMNVELNDLPILVSETESKVENAKIKLKELESITVKYIDALRAAVQDNNSSSKQKNWDVVGRLEMAKNRTEEQVEQIVEHTNQQLEELHYAIEQHKNTEKALENNIIPESIEAYGNLQYELTGAINQVRKLQNDIAMLKRYRDLVSASHGDLQDDLEALLEHIDRKTPNKGTESMNVDELNDLISVAHARIASLQKKLDHLEHSEKERMKSAMDAQRRADESLREQYVKQELDLERSRHDIERHKWLLQARENTERELKLALARHSEHLSHMLQLERDKMEHEFQFRLREALAKERVTFEAALVGWRKRMEAIEDVVDGRADLDRLAKEAQSLWLACEALACRLHSVSPTMMSHHKAKDDSTLVNHTGSLKDFVNSIRECTSSGNYPFANEILNSLSDDVIEKGVWTEVGLKKRFEKVYNVCRNVTLIDETSGSLWEYALSWLQSALIVDMKYKCLQALSFINPNVIDGGGGQKLDLSAYEEDVVVMKQTNSPKLDPFCLLSAAKQAMLNDHNILSDSDEDTCSDEGLETAVRLLGQLRGQARVVADDWLVDARHYLEVKQTARTLLAYAAARDISTFQKRFVHCCTWNVGDEKPGNEDLSSLLGVTAKPFPDVISVALQEVSGEDFWRQKLMEHLYPRGYVLIKSRNCWAIWIFAFLKRNLLPAVTNIESEVTASGYAGVMGNKGGVSARFELCGINMIFLSCHFTAHMENKRDRLNDYFDIIDHQSFRDEDVNVILDHDYVFWMGDLNFRIDHFKKDEVEQMIRENRLDELLRHDQLLNMKNDKLLFHDFNEGTISFPPTFKFDKGTDIYDSSKKQRVPAWTDRILYMVHRDFALDHHLNLPQTGRQRSVSPSRRLPVRGPPSQVEEKFPSNESIKGRQHPEAVLLKYTSLSEYKLSDHRPVIAVFRLSVPPRWFSLPVRFEEPNGKEYSCYANLDISYRVLDPPGLLRLSESNLLLSPRESSPVCDFTKLLLLNTPLKSINQQGNSEKPKDDIGPLAPPTLQTTSFDWIGLYPAEFADLERDYITYVYASSSVSQTKHRKNSLSSALLQAPNATNSQECFYKAKIESNRLKDLAGQSFCLVYMSRNKHCPQGYSAPFKISRVSSRR
ncbi:unnamed protein product [Trichobilharzia szidati]|nr:unnamed protein product [Trichobilharzia szidati]